MGFIVRKAIKFVAKGVDSVVISEVKSAASDACTVATELFINRHNKADIDTVNGDTELLDGGIGSESGSFSEKQECGVLKEELKEVLPFLALAEKAYGDENIAENSNIPSVIKSRLVKGDRSASSLFHNMPIRVKTDTQVHVCLLDDGSLAFVFRGTESKTSGMSVVRDWTTDVMKRQVPVIHYNGSDEKVYDGRESDIKAHRGFLLAFQDVTKPCSPEENIRLAAEELGASAETVRRVFCIGHSLGGALATLCAHWCRHVVYPEAEIWCITMGSPRVGNWRFVDDFEHSVLAEGKSIRLVNHGDIVPRVPRFSISAVYKHIGGYHFMLPDPKRKGKTCISRRKISVTSLSIQNHLMKSYMKAFNSFVYSP